MYFRLDALLRVYVSTTGRRIHERRFPIQSEHMISLSNFCDAVKHQCSRRYEGCR